MPFSFEDEMAGHDAIIDTTEQPTYCNLIHSRMSAQNEESMDILC